jgi:hypothetical protein
LAGVTLRIETSGWERPVIRISGRMDSEHLADVKRCVRVPASPPALDLQEVTLVDVDAVHFLISCEDEGIELLHCSPYIRQWMAQERPNRR